MVKREEGRRGEERRGEERRGEESRRGEETAARRRIGEGGLEENEREAGFYVDKQGEKNC